jgi:hypothetical protein
VVTNRRRQRKVVPSNEMFKGESQPSGDLAGVFEYDGEVAYFYLCRRTAPENEKVVSAIHVLTGKPDFGAEDVSIAWDDHRRKVVSGFAGGCGRSSMSKQARRTVGTTTHELRRRYR